MIDSMYTSELLKFEESLATLTMKIERRRGKQQINAYEDYIQEYEQ